MTPREHLRLISPTLEQTPTFLAEGATVYEEFYQTYGASFVDADGRASYERLVDGRVLHCDAPLDRSIHLMVHEKYGSRVQTSLFRTDTAGRPYHHFNYDVSGFAVITTDGQSIQQWQIDQAYGIHDGRINAIDQQYKPENEALYFILIDEDATRMQLKVARVGGAGVMEFGSGVAGWILDAEVSLAERERLLQPLGSTALAS